MSTTPDTEELVEVMARALNPHGWASWDRERASPVMQGRALDAVREGLGIDRSLTNARASLSALRRWEREKGWQCVPRQMTREMRDAAVSGTAAHYVVGDPHRVLALIADAAPPAPGTEEA